MKKVFIPIIFILTLSFSNFAFAQTTTAPVEEEKKEMISLDRAKGRIGIFLEKLENTRIYYGEYFLKLRDKYKAIFDKPLEVGDLDKEPQTDVAGVEDTGKMKLPIPDEAKDHLVEYGKYLLYSSLYSFFSNKAIFYAGLILIVFLSLRFILRRFL